ncbi:MAG TPA: MFS transporter [Acidimicrobiales bacterium]
MSKVVTTRVVPREAVAAFLQPRDGLVLEAVEPGSDAVDGRFVLSRGPFLAYERVVTHQPARADDGSAPDNEVEVEVTETITYQMAVPIWGFLFARPVRRALRNPRPRRAWWMPPDLLDARATSGLSRLCVFSVLAGYLGTLLSQTNTFFKEDFGSTDGQIGTMLAVVRVGALLALAVVALADRRGRRWVLLASALAGCVITATGALAPNLVWLGVSQTIARAFATALILVISIIAVEEMPAGSRAFAISLLTATAALGGGICVMMLGIAGLGPGAWRVLFVVPVVAIPVVVRLGRHLPETHRFAAAETRGAPVSRRRRWWRIPEGLDRGRLALLSLSGLALSVFAIPASAFLNEYLRTERHFTTGAIIVFQLATNTPGGLGIVVGGKLADRRGRRMVGAVGLAAGVGFSLATYLVAGWPIWLFSLLAALIGAMAIPALAVYGPELFPTHLRGSANGIINLASVVGSAAGLFLAGRLADRLSSLGPAMAVLALGPVVVIGLVLFRYPETASVELEQLNPDDAPLSRDLLALDGLDLLPQRYPPHTDET